MVGRLVLCALLLCFGSTAECYEGEDPDGSITIRWDILEWRSTDGYSAMVSIFNHQAFRAVQSPPGWRLSWTWKGKEVIWAMTGAEATHQGDCSRIKSQPLPHSCAHRPVIVDLLPGATYNMQTSNCCKAGVLTTFNQNPTMSVASFQMAVGNAVIGDDGGDDGGVFVDMPDDYMLGLPGYSCGAAGRVGSTKFPQKDGRRWTQALLTYTIKCTYSQYRASLTPVCCVSLSSFYNDTIVPCPLCSCACESDPSISKRCLGSDEQASYLRMPNEEDRIKSPIVKCTSHMCPIKVHWHLKQSYRGYWRVKITIMNFNVFRNYSDWTLVVQHPDLTNITKLFSFKSAALGAYRGKGDTVMFWGVRYYNDMLLQYGENGNVQTEMVLPKGEDFTFRGGYGFPRSIMFNGDECVMPPPDEYPQLPRHSSASSLIAFYQLFLGGVLYGIGCIV